MDEKERWKGDNACFTQFIIDTIIANIVQCYSYTVWNAWIMGQASRKKY